jgi:hypothetical protein
MTIPLIRFHNGDHVFYALYAQPQKARVEASGKTPDLVYFTLPEGVQFLINENGEENLYIDNEPAAVATDILTGAVILRSVNNTAVLEPLKIAGKKVLRFPVKAAV